MLILTATEEKALEWGKENIEFVGTKHTNKWKGRYSPKYGREFIPISIVDHISQGTMRSLKSWFTGTTNSQSSSHFGVGKNGEVVQFVKIEDRAWCNGRIHDPSSDLVNEVGLNVNPNQYTVSIEHVGVWEDTRGDLTPEQLEASINLHAYIVAYVKKYWDFDIEVSRMNIIGHCEIDTLNKMNCPGQLFPYDAILKGTKEKLNPTITEVGGFIDIAGHWAEDFILRAVELGFLEGDTMSRINPDKPSTRAELICVILKLYDKVRDDLGDIFKEILDDLVKQSQ